MKIAISAESTIDLTKELLEKYDVKTVPFQVLLGETEYKDGEIQPTEIFEFVKQNKVLPKTSAINSVQYKEYFENILKDYDAIIHISLSSQISSSCSHAVETAKEMKNVYVVDSQSLSTGIALLAVYARELANNGSTAEEVYEKTCAQVENVQASFVIDRLDYLHKGGRCSALALFGANLLKIHPQIMVKDGKMGVHKKYRGKMEKVVEDYCRDCLQEFSDANKKLAFVTYTTASDEMIATARKALEENGFETICETKAGATISRHCGENTLGILFLNN